MEQKYEVMCKDSNVLYFSLCILFSDRVYYAQKLTILICACEIRANRRVAKSSDCPQKLCTINSITHFKKEGVHLLTSKHDHIITLYT